MSYQKSIVILGSTGSIGQQALAVAQALPERLRVVGLAAHSNCELLAQQITEWQPAIAALADETAAIRLRQVIGNSPTKVVSGLSGLLEVAAYEQSTLVLSAMLGAAGLRPTLAAIEAGKDVAIANKETLVAAGEIVVAAARAKGVSLLPVDSEHSAIAQCLVGEAPESVARLTITASGGPFADLSREELKKVLPQQALRHPTWSMGRKITVDSATLMNKALEAIEAHWLFGVPLAKIDIVVHRQSVVHSLVTFQDNSVKAQLGVPDMRLPIQWGLLFPERIGGAAPALDLLTMGPLTFEPPDATRFPALNLFRGAMQAGGTAPAAMNAANEVAVHAFLDGATSFYGITDCVEAVLERHQSIRRPGLDDIYAADADARLAACTFLQWQS
ncbi:MAG TPA: 1-deoxy-D-xylulose-5-phosphate reductoisomerase [Abditibacteriaceae bacterium]|nr:1-deoxy-D-xylulose-5-phosphate reductoisomerase [Abditibacteriaceae bacterium]